MTMNDNATMFARTKNNGMLPLTDIPVISYHDFSQLMVNLLSQKENHCASYFAIKEVFGLQFFAVIANDNNHEIFVLSFTLESDKIQQLVSLTPQLPSIQIFEREMFENFGVDFHGHPWLKPVRYAHNRANKSKTISNYPFYKIESHELHEVGVGPIHAGVIEPGHFKFICNGENVLHLEIQLGWQHRGIETLMLEKKQLLQRNILAENIAGDTAIGHSLAFVHLMESLGEIEIPEQLGIERSLALELERIAIHVGDISALCTDVAYHLGANIFGILRTGIINFTQSWCGNRLGKSMIRTGGINLPFTPHHKKSLLEMIEKFELQFNELALRTLNLPSIENRFDGIGTVSTEIIEKIGAVGMTARMANVNRDIRKSHPFAAFYTYPIEPIVLPSGDVLSRFMLRRMEIEASIAWIKNVLEHKNFEKPSEKPTEYVNLKPNSLAISLTEGWRGEICHCAITGFDGQLLAYKVKDPSMHNWKALEISLRNLEISDFPINNKSYNLSYCGFDL